MIVKEEYLVKLNNKNRIQKVKVVLESTDLEDKYFLHRITGQYGGKETSQPVITIDSGKVKRTTAEQAMLIFNSHLKKYMDSGYSLLSKLTYSKYENLTEKEISSLLGNVVTDQSGIPKPMLAKSVDKCSANVYESEYYTSSKLDGVRCLMYYKDGEIKTASRGGGTYNVATTHLRTEPKLIEFFESNPDIILDGELYKHDSQYPLQRISGLARLQEWDPECEALEYWIYDYISDKPFKKRWEFLQELTDTFKDTKIKIVSHKLLKGYVTIKREHDRVVKEGFEGICLRNPDKEYGVNKRSGVYLLKMKQYQDAEFEIIDVRKGLRPEDMCFVLKTKDGIEFAAKPMGTAETRENYLNNKDEFIGKMATCKYFELSTGGVPMQPIMVRLRPDDE